MSEKHTAYKKRGFIKGCLAVPVGDTFIGSRENPFNKEPLTLETFTPYSPWQLFWCSCHFRACLQRVREAPDFLFHLSQMLWCLWISVGWKLRYSSVRQSPHQPTSDSDVRIPSVDGLRYRTAVYLWFICLINAFWNVEGLLFTIGNGDEKRPNQSGFQTELKYYLKLCFNKELEMGCKLKGI